MYKTIYRSLTLLLAIFVCSSQASASGCFRDEPCDNYGRGFDGAGAYAGPYGQGAYKDYGYRDPGCGDGPCGPDREALRQRALQEAEKYEPCGAWCWVDRFRDGYCGPGCDFYREHTQFETGYANVERPRALSLKDTPDYGCPGQGGCAQGDLPRYERYNGLDNGYNGFNGYRGFNGDPRYERYNGGFDDRRRLSEGQFRNDAGRPREFGPRFGDNGRFGRGRGLDRDLTPDKPYQGPAYPPR